MSSTNKRIKEFRKSQGISQSEFAKRIGLKQGSLSEIENGKEPLIDRIKKLICLEFGVNEEWLLTGKGEMLKSTELTSDKKRLLEVFDKLELEGRKEVQKYADERLELQEYRADLENSFQKGLEGKTLKFVEEVEGIEDDEKGENPIHKQDRG